MKPAHDLLWKVCRDKDEYLAAPKTDGPWRPDCSCGCLHFRELAGPAGLDWGVCTEPRSPRAGLLTFEHMGCPFFEEDPHYHDEK